MARRPGVILALAAVLLVAAAAAATAQSDSKGKGPKDNKPQGPSQGSPMAEGPKEDKAKGLKQKEEKAEVPKSKEEKEKGPKQKEDKAEGPKQNENKPVEPKPKEDKPEKQKPKEDKPEDPKSPPKAEEPKPKPKEDKPEDPKSPPKREDPKAKPKPNQVKCHVNPKVDPYCFNKKMDCPDNCPETCSASCKPYDCKAVCSCDQPGAVCGDPRFIGGDGNVFFFHGRKDADFCVVSDRDLHINAHFIGKPGHSGMSRYFTWIQAIGVLFDGHRFYVGARKTVTWDDAVEHLEITLDGEPVHLPTDQVQDVKWTSSHVPQLSLTRTKATNGLLVALDEKFSVRVNAVPITEEDSRVHRYGVTSDDCLAHLELAFKFDALTDDVHGVVGQTYRSDYVNKLDVRASMPTMGGDASFAASGLFAADCAVSRFGTNHSNDEASLMSELAGVTCASGMNGQGVVCKK